MEGPEIHAEFDLESLKRIANTERLAGGYALRFTPAAGSVEVALQTDKVGVNLIVRDTGPGLGEGDKAQVFERFCRADTDRSGSGPGLAIVRSIVELHGGRVEAMNAAEGGAEFQVALPYHGSPERSGLDSEVRYEGADAEMQCSSSAQTQYEGVALNALNHRIE